MITVTNKIYGSVLLRSIQAGVVHYIKPVDDHPGHFIVDHEVHVYLKYDRGDDMAWQFGFSSAFVSTLRDIQTRTDLFGGPYLWLVCGENPCELRPDEWNRILETGTPDVHQTIRVSRPPRHSFRVSGSKRELPYTIPVNRFPSLAVAA